MQVEDKIPEIEAMRMGVDYSFVVSLRKFSCKMRPLANSEITLAYGNVAEAVRNLPEFRRNEFTIDNLKAREFLKLASADFGQYPGKLTDVILDKMSTDEIMYLYKEWMAICDKVNPQLESLPIDRIKELVAEIKKNTPADLDYQLTELSFGQMRSILQYLLTNGD